MLNSTDA